MMLSCFESQPPAAIAAVAEPTTAGPALGTSATLLAPGLGDSDLPLPPRFPLRVFRVGVLSSKLVSFLIGGGLGPTCCMIICFLHKRAKQQQQHSRELCTRDELQAFPGQACVCMHHTTPHHRVVESFRVFAGVGLLVCVSGKGVWSYAEALLLAGCCGAGCRRLLRLLQKSCKNQKKIMTVTDFWRAIKKMTVRRT